MGYGKKFYGELLCVLFLEMVVVEGGMEIVGDL